MNILLGVTGSVAAILTPKIVKALQDAGHVVDVVSTNRGLFFFNENEVNTLVWKDKDEWQNDGYHKNDPVLHIEFHKTADLLLIAPLTADTLADIASGKADKFLTCIARAWPNDKPFLVAPAMNTNMWNHPITSEQLEKIRSWFPKFHVINPISKRLACGDTGMGAMADITTIVATVKQCEVTQ